MRPIRTKDTPVTFKGFQPDMADLPAAVEITEDGPCIRSVFRLTDEEREQLLVGNGAIMLSIWTPDGQPPVNLSVTTEVEVVHEDDLRCADCGALYVKSREMERCGQCGGELVSEFKG